MQRILVCHVNAGLRMYSSGFARYTTLLWWVFLLTNRGLRVLVHRVKAVPNAYAAYMGHHASHMHRLLQGMASTTSGRQRCERTPAPVYCVSQRNATHMPHKAVNL